MIISVVSENKEFFTIDLHWMLGIKVLNLNFLDFAVTLLGSVSEIADSVHNQSRFGPNGYHIIFII